MNCVYLDASRNRLAVGLSVGAEWVEAGDLEGRHDAVLLPALTELLDRCHTNLASVDAVICVQGPGSFTGLRIAVSAVHALHLVTQCQVLPVDQLSLMAFVARSQGCDAPCDVLLDARMGDVYIGRGGFIPDTPRLVDRELLAVGALTGNTWIGHLDETVFLPDRVIHRVAPTLQDLKVYGEACPQSFWMPGDQLTPLYLRQTISWTPLADQPSKLYES